jgi:general secretion pathway protein G
MARHRPTRPATGPSTGLGTGRSTPLTTGFTLIELLVTVTIVAILASAALPMAEVAVQRSQEQELRAALREIRAAIDAYRQAVDDGRIVKSLHGSGYPESLAVLVEGVADAKNPAGGKIYFLRRLPRDPLHPGATVAAGETWGKRAYASPPDDPREGEDVYDVYTLAEGIGINGIPYRQW